MVLSRVAEVFGGLPFLPFALILSAVIPREISVTQRMYIIMCVLGVLSWVPDFRLVRAQIFSQREQEYVTGWPRPLASGRAAFCVSTSFPT